MDKWLRNSNAVKIVALVLAVLLWALVHMNDKALPGNGAISPTLRDETIHSVKVTPVNNTPQLSIVAITPSEVIVYMKGKPSSLKKITTNDNYKVTVDLNGLGVGEYYLPLKPVGFPSDVSVDTSPRTVKVVLEEIQKKEVPVDIKVTGTPSAGLKAGSPIVKPNRVHVTLPSHQMEDSISVKGEVNVDKANSPVSRQVKLVAVDKQGNPLNVAITPAVVDVEVPITKPFKTIPLRIGLGGQPPNGYAVAAVTQSVDTVTVYGPQDIIDKMEFYDGPAINLTNQTQTKQYSLDIPLKDKVIQVEPAKADVKVEITASATKRIENVPIKFVGQNSEFTVKLVSPASSSIPVNVEGAPTNLDKLTPNNIEAFVNVSNLPPGDHDLPIELNLPTLIKSAEPEQLKAKVEIKAKPAAANTQ